MLEENVKLLEMYGKISILLGEVAPTTCENNTYWLVSDNGIDYMIQLSTNTNNVVLHIIGLMKVNDYTIQIDSYDTIYIIIGYATELGVKTLYGE